MSEMTYKALSLGWGVQSFTLAAMSALGEFECPDIAIHADTTHESWLTYRVAERWTPWLIGLGISTDEALRMKQSNAKYITNRWPLIELGMSRKDCAAWLVAHDLEVPPKSACTFCPYHNTAEWRRIKASPEDWDEAVSVDRAIRKARPPYDL